MNLRILNEEPDIGRHITRLDGRQVRPDNLRLWILVAHLDGPFPGAGGDVQDTLRRVRTREGCQVIPVI